MRKRRAALVLHLRHGPLETPGHESGHGRAGSAVNGVAEALHERCWQKKRDALPSRRRIAVAFPAFLALARPQSRRCSQRVGIRRSGTMLLPSLDHGRYRCELRSLLCRTLGKKILIFRVSRTAMTPPKRTVLVCEDDASIRALLERVALREGYAVEVAATGSEALRRIEGGGYAAIVLDLMLPGMTGVEIIERLRRTNPTMLARIVVITASTSALNKPPQEVGAFFAKPFDIHDLTSSMRRIANEERSFGT